jgi:carnitine monooxygenase subunit
MAVATDRTNDVALLLEHLNDSPERSLSLPPSFYYEKRFMELERDEIFHKSWQFLCHGEKLRERGNYVSGTVMGRSVFAVRGQDGVVRAFYNVCRHRGHELVRRDGQARAISCPYHAWSYNLDGSLRAAPGTECLAGFRKENYSLIDVPVEDFAGLYFVNFDRNAESLSKSAGDLKTAIERYAPDLPRLTFAHRLSYTIQANWKAVVDNFLECRHCPVAHKDFCSLIDMNTYEVENRGVFISHMAKAKEAGNSAYNTAAATVTDHAVWYLWPNMALMRYPGRGNFMIWRFIPDGPETTKEEFDFFFETSTPTPEEEEAIRYIDTVLQQEDIDIVESVQRGMHSPGFNRGPYLIDPKRSGLSEHGVHHFHAMLAKAYSRAQAAHTHHSGAICT